MAGNLIPLVALTGAAFFLTRKGDSKEAPKDNECDPLDPSTWGEGNMCVEQNGRWVKAEEGGLTTGFVEETGIDQTLQMPMITTSDDHTAWGNIIKGKDPTWIGTIEFLNMDTYLEKMGHFIEEEMDIYEDVYGRTVDRSELDPVAAEAMIEENEVVESTLADLFAANVGLEMLLLFIKPEGSKSMGVYFLFDTQANQDAAVGNIANFKTALEGLGIQSYLRYGYRDMQSPSAKDSVRAYLAAMLPKKPLQSGFLPSGSSIPTAPNP